MSYIIPADLIGQLTDHEWEALYTGVIPCAMRILNNKAKENPDRLVGKLDPTTLTAASLAAVPDQEFTDPMKEVFATLLHRAGCSVVLQPAEISERSPENKYSWIIVSRPRPSKFLTRIQVKKEGEGHIP